MSHGAPKTKTKNRCTCPRKPYSPLNICCLPLLCLLLFGISLAASAMAGNFFVSCLLLSSLFVFFSATKATISDAPFLVSHKKVALTRLKSGAEQVSVSIDIYNQGFATAYDVSLSDDSWSQDIFNLISGNTSKSWERLDAGSSVSHSFVLESKVKGVYYGAPAIIKYRVPSKAVLQEAYSTPILPLDILAERPPEKKFEFVKRFFAKYGSLISVLSIVGLFVFAILSPSKSSAAKGSKKRR